MSPPPLPGSKPKSAVSPLLIALVGLLILLVPVCSVLQDAGDRGGNKQAQTVPFAAAEFARRLIRDPKTAEFDTASQGWKPRRDGRFEAWGSVRAQNAFGAYVTQDWKVLLEPVNGGEQWKAIGIQVGTTKTGEFPEDRP